MKPPRLSKVKSYSYHYDYLILAMGGEANDFGVAGVKENGFTLWSLAAAERIRAHIKECCAKAEHEPNQAKRLPYSALSSAVQALLGLKWSAN